MQVKLILTDLDGTAIDSPNTSKVSPRLADAIRAADDMGIKVCAVSGRATAGARDVLVEMALKDPAIVSGGARIIDPVSGKELWGVDIDPKALDKVLECLKGTNYPVVWNDFTAEEYIDGAWPRENFTSTKDIYFFEVCYIPDEEAPALSEKLKKIDGIAVVRSNAWRDNHTDLHLMNKGATKEHSVYELQKMLGISKEESVGVGDGHNDIHLYNAVGYKVAMGNAVDDLKEAADRVIGSVKEDGLAKFIEEVVKNKGKI